jgi:hypothetical protein
MHRPGKLVACCSTAMSITALFAGSLFVALDDPGKARTTLSWIADQLPMLLDQSMREEVASLIQRAIPGGLQLGQGMKREAAGVKTELGHRTIAAAVVSQKASDSYADMNTNGSTRSPDATFPPEKTLRSEVVWLVDQPGSPSLFALSRDDKGTNVKFLISGENTSDQPLTEVQGVLKPDSSGGNLELNLSLNGNATDESVRTIPPGAQFILVYIFPNHPKGLSTNSFIENLGGAIFTFHYTHAGARKAFLCYFSPSRLKTELRNVEAVETPPRPQRNTPGAIRPAGAPA